MSKKFTPLYDRILVKRNEIETVSGAGYAGVAIPGSNLLAASGYAEKPHEGSVISVGQGRINESGTVFPLNVAEGNKILFGKYAGTEITLDGEEFLIMREEEVLGIIRD